MHTCLKLNSDNLLVTLMLHYKMCSKWRPHIPGVGSEGAVQLNGSPDLTPLDFFLWGHIKRLVYETPVPDEETLLVRILADSDEVRGMSDVFCRVRQSFLHRCNACTECAGRHFEHIL